MNDSRAPDFEAIYSRFQGSLLRFFRAKVRDPGVAEDLTQETLLKLYRSKDQIDPDRSLSAWLRTLARNVLIDWIRKEAPMSHQTSPWEESQPEEIACSRGDPERYAHLLSQRRLLRDLLRHLNPQQRRILWLRFIRSVSDSEIARELGISLSAVRSAIYRIRIRLSALESFA